MACSREENLLDSLNYSRSVRGLEGAVETRGMDLMEAVSERGKLRGLARR